MTELTNWRLPTIALVADEFTRYSLEPDAKLINLTPVNWRWKLRLYRPDYLLVESAWRGYRDTWRGKIAYYSDRKKDGELEKLVQHCRNIDVPTIFWNKEDPFHFQRFVETAQLFDMVYTTDANSISKYEALPRHRIKKIGLMMFAAQPVHYQRGEGRASRPLAFMGGYYGQELNERSRQQDEILGRLADVPLVIYDRFWGQGQQSSYPENLQHLCLPAISNKLVPEICHQYNVHLNFNTVQDSPTMLSRRVFELACAGCVIISTPSHAMQQIFGDNIAVVTNGQTAYDQYLSLTSDPARQHEMREQVRRIVLSEHTWQHRLKRIHHDLCAL
ncbi:CgeB family protein [Aeromonas veronii]|uniref:CgeB family protein n=1 Tax=Aeromonas veronii TaxID=654 RepID=UPI003D247012